MSVQIIIEDHVIPQLITAAIEAYAFRHRASLRDAGKEKLETTGILWGYVIPARGDHPARIVATQATIETSAIRHQDWVQTNFECVRMKKEFFRQYWPQLELVGTFHSHPYASLDEVRQTKGWRASSRLTTGKDGDMEYWPHFHQEIAPEISHMAHLIVTITELQKTGWALPKQLEGKDDGAGYELGSAKRKFWIRGYASAANQPNPNSKRRAPPFISTADVQLDIPSLVKRFLP